MKKDIIVVGGSAGGLDAVQTLVRGLPPDFPGVVCVVVHASEGGHGYLADILNRENSLTAIRVSEPVPMRPRHIYTPRPNFHLVIVDGTVRTLSGPRENRFRPSIDVLFRSAARAYGGRAVGVLLSGYLDDGVSGLGTIKEAGGTTIVQAPCDAKVPAMPENALEEIEIDHCLPAAEIPELLVRLVSQDAMKPTNGQGDIMPNSSTNPPSRYTCPDCGGTLFEVTEGNLQRFRCRVGHAFSEQSLLAAEDDHVEELLWAAQRALEERAELQARIASRYLERDHPALQRKFNKRAELSRQEANALKKVLAGVTSANDWASEPAPEKTRARKRSA